MEQRKRKAERPLPTVRAVELMPELRRKLNERLSRMTREEQIRYLREHYGRGGRTETREAR